MYGAHVCVCPSASARVRACVRACVRAFVCVGVQRQCLSLLFSWLFSWSLVCARVRCFHVGALLQQDRGENNPNRMFGTFKNRAHAGDAAFFEGKTVRFSGRVPVRIRCSLCGKWVRRCRLSLSID